MHRRQFLGSTAAASAAILTSAGCVTPENNRTLRGARIPGEFEPMKAVWLGYSDDAEKLAVTSRMASALLPYVRVKLAVPDQAALIKTRESLRVLGVDSAKIEFFVHPKAPYFIRDYNLFTIDGSGKLGVVDFKWNTYGLPGWCRNYLYPDKQQSAEKCAAYDDASFDIVDQWMAEVTGAGITKSSLFMEGGAIEANGRGVLLVSEPLALQRNAGVSRNIIESEFLKLPGIEKVIWLADGAAEDPHMKHTIVGDYVGWGTGGHTDEFVRFADARTILLAWVDEDEAAAHPVNRINRARMQRNFDILTLSTDAQGRRFRIVKVPMPTIIEKEMTITKSYVTDEGWYLGVFPNSEGRKAGDRVKHVAAASYLNYLVANNVVLLPDYSKDGTSPAAQQKVASIFQKAFSGRDIKFIDSTRLNWSGGGIHCATCSEPTAV